MYFKDSIKMKQSWLLVGVLIVLFPILSLAQVKEKIDRGPVALTVKEKVVYVGWRLLKDDPEDVAFNVYRRDMGLGGFEKVNQKPIRKSTNFLDTTALPGHGYEYKVKTLTNGIERDSRGQAYVFALTGNQPWYSI